MSWERKKGSKNIKNKRGCPSYRQAMIDNLDSLILLFLESVGLAIAFFTSPLAVP